MPYAQYDTLEARRQAQHDWGIASDKETDQGNSNEEDKEQEKLVILNNRFFHLELSRKFWHVIENHAIHKTLHWAKKVMVKLWDVDDLVDDQVERPPSLWVVTGNHTTHSLISLRSKRLVIAHNGNRLVII